MDYFETHCHLIDERFDDDREAVIQRMRDTGIRRAVLVGDAVDGPNGTFAITRANDFIYSALGVHPQDASCWSDAHAEKLRIWLGADKVVALGEIGLDYYYETSPREIQRVAFEAQMDMALDLDLPVILHVRDAHGEMIERLTERYRTGRLPRAVLHCYSGSWESAETYLNMGLYISFTGAVTFKNARKAVEVAEKMPIGRVMIETDCPYLAPEPVRGHRNEPANLVHIARRIAAIRGMDEADFVRASYENASRFFGV